MSVGPDALLTVSGLTKRFGGFTALSEVDFAIRAGERVGIIGPNGAGKSTFVNSLAGTLRPDAGRIAFDGHTIDHLPPHQRARLGLTRSFQLPRPFRSMTALENILVPIAYVRPTRDGHHIDTQNRRAEAHRVLSMVGLAAKADAPAGSLTQVDLRKLELARAMAANPKLLLSDESMAGLADHEVEEVLDVLFAINKAGVAIVMIEHIIKAVTRFSERIVVLVSGSKLADGAPADVMRMPDVQKAYLGE